MLDFQDYPYKREVFETLSALRENQEAKTQVPEGWVGRWPDFNAPGVLFRRGQLLWGIWFQMFSAAAKAGKAGIAEHLTRQFIKQMIDRFGFDGDPASNFTDMTARVERSHERERRY